MKNADSKNGKEVNKPDADTSGRLKIGDETVLTIVGNDGGDIETVDGGGVDEEKLRLTENPDGEAVNGNGKASNKNKNGVASANGTPAKAGDKGGAAGAGGGKFRIPDWMWTPKGPGGQGDRGPNRDRRKAIIGDYK
jgi:hypothetical protein